MATPRVRAQSMPPAMKFLPTTLLVGLLILTPGARRRQRSRRYRAHVGVRHPRHEERALTGGSWPSKIDRQPWPFKCGPELKRRAIFKDTLGSAPIARTVLIEIAQYGRQLARDQRVEQNVTPKA